MFNGCIGLTTNISYHFQFHIDIKFEISFHIKNNPHLFKQPDLGMDPSQQNIYKGMDSGTGYAVEIKAIMDFIEEGHNENGEVSLVLVRKVVSNRRYTVETMGKVMEKAWRLPREFKAKKLTTNIFKFTF